MQIEQSLALPQNVLGVGIDICEVKRIARDLANIPNFAQEFCNPEEVAYSDRRRGRLRAEHYSSLWASKEATYKALNNASRKKVGTGLVDLPLKPHEITVLRYESGQPYIQLLGQTGEVAENLGIDSFSLSNSHEREHAIAISMALSNPEIYRPLVEKSALITGSTRFNGIGFAIAERFAQDGISKLILIGTENSRERIPALQEHFSKLGTEAHILIGNVIDEQRCVEMMKSAYEFAGGNVDILVNNAGVNQNASFVETTVANWDDVMDVKTKGAFLMTREWFMIRNLRNIKGGRVINIASIIGIYGNNGQAAYDTANGGLIAFTKGRALEFGSRGITVNAILPGFVEGTDMTQGVNQLGAIKAATPLNVLMTTKDVAAAAAFFAGPDAGKLTGIALPVDGGLGGNYTALYSLHRAGFRQIPRVALSVVERLSPDEVKLIKDHRNE